MSETLKRNANLFTNLGAVGLVCYLFYATQQEMFELTREDRKLFREALAAERDHSMKIANSVVAAIKDNEKLILETLQTCQENQKLLLKLNNQKF